MIHINATLMVGYGYNIQICKIRKVFVGGLERKQGYKSSDSSINTLGKQKLVSFIMLLWPCFSDETLNRYCFNRQVTIHGVTNQPVSEIQKQGGENLQHMHSSESRNLHCSIDLHLSLLTLPKGNSQFFQWPLSTTESISSFLLPTL